MSDHEALEPVDPDAMELDNECDDGNGLKIDGSSEGLENIWDYNKGGHQPVYLGDLFGVEGKGRYKVIHKLGHGRFANVWLCRDLKKQNPEYVALKIIMAEHSECSLNKDCRELNIDQVKKRLLITEDEDPTKRTWQHHICLPLNSFTLSGPNGFHKCFVYPLAGPQITHFLQESSYRNLDDATLRRLAHQAVRAMAKLHSLGIVHGDFTPANLLLQIRGLDGLSEEEVKKVLGAPKTVRVVKEGGGEVDTPEAPRYLVYPVDFSKVDPQLFVNSICVIDYGESFEPLFNRPEDLNTPKAYRSPELLLEKKAHMASDIWALGCTLFEIRAGCKLFSTYDDNDDDAYLFHIALLLGVFPEPWWTESWKNRKRFFIDGADKEGRPILTSMLRREHRHLDYQAHRSIIKALEGRRKFQTLYSDGTITHHTREILNDEAKVFADLLGKIFRYEPTERLSPLEIMAHEWFRFDE